MDGSIDRQCGQLAALILKLFFEQGALLLLYNALLFGHTQVLFGLQLKQFACLDAHHTAGSPAYNQVNNKRKQQHIQHNGGPRQQQRACTDKGIPARTQRAAGGINYTYREAIRTIMQVAKRAQRLSGFHAARGAAALKLPYKAQGLVIVVGERGGEGYITVYGGFVAG